MLSSDILVLHLDSGSLILEMGALSRLTSDPRYESAALRALRKLWSMRSSLNLFGTTLDVVTGEWIEFSSGIGAGTCYVFIIYNVIYNFGPEKMLIPLVKWSRLMPLEFIT